MNGDTEAREAPEHRIQDFEAIRLFGSFVTNFPRRDEDRPFWWPVSEDREAISRDALLITLWRDRTHLGLDNKPHIQGMLFGHYNREAYPGGVAVDPVAVLVSLKEWESNIDLMPGGSCSE